MENKPLSEETAKKLAQLLTRAPTGAADLAKKPIAQIRNNQIAAGIAGTIGLVMFALGVENLIISITELSSPYIEIVIGLFLLTISGLLLKKLT